MRRGRGGTEQARGAVGGPVRLLLAPVLPIWRRLAVRTRAALAAAAASALVFGLATAWVSSEVHDALLVRAQDRAFTANQNVWSKIPGSPDEAYQASTYVVLTQDGRVLRRSNVLAVVPPDDTAFWRAHFPPIDPVVESAVHGYPMVTVQLPEWLAKGWPDPNAGPPRTVQPGESTTHAYHFFTFVTDHTFTSAELAAYSGQSGLPPGPLTGYTLIDEAETDQTTAQITTILGWYLLPGGSLFVALMAWLVTGLALRPVESIRRRMARIGEGAFHERVPVPPSRDGIARLAETTNETLAKLERALAEQRRLVADASHELRSPLAVLRATLEVPLLHPGDVEWRGVVVDALAGTERLQDLADDLLLLARTEEDHAAAQYTVELHDLVAEQLAERGHTDPRLRWHGSVEPARVPGRDSPVGRVVRNLLDNAARYASSQVEVTLQAVDGWAVLTVADDGPGIPVADRQRVFERFVRLDSARSRSTGGAGLGLALARSIAHGLGGTVLAEPPTNLPGAKLSVRLPLVP
ncbi:sensor histidine kinase [Kitasatospora sp. NPDC008050]|uniref:sensor histidine kinase n=1 Tax=Kitasatospora sp. NPDC008050 TaxID=3364021 RepID=UPI0036E87D38